MRVPGGSAATPGYTFIEDPDTGILRPAANRLQIATGGTARWEVDSSGHLVPVADNTYDIGSSSAAVKDIHIDGLIQGAIASPVSYTPALTASVTNPTLGTSPTTTGAYFTFGNLVVGWGTIIAGATGSVTAGSGNYQVSIPVSAAGQANNARMTWGNFTALIGGVAKVGILKRSTGTTALLQGGGDTGVVTNAVPGGWTNNDEIKYLWIVTTV